MTSLLQRSVTGLLRAASIFALLGLSIMCASLIWPRALLVIFAMSVGHLIGFAAFACYVLAVVVDSRRQRLQPSAHPSTAPAAPATAPTPELVASDERAPADEP